MHLSDLVDLTWPASAPDKFPFVWMTRSSLMPNNQNAGFLLTGFQDLKEFQKDCSLFKCRNYILLNKYWLDKFKSKIQIKKSYIRRLLLQRKRIQARLLLSKRDFSGSSWSNF
jgi:hypothetical protein